MDKNLKDDAAVIGRRDFLVQLAVAGMAAGGGLSLPGQARADVPADRKVKLTYYFYAASYSPNDHENSMNLVENMRKLGVDVNPQPRPDFVSLFSAMDDPWNFDLTHHSFLGNPARLDPDVLLYGTLNAKFADKKSSYNVMGYRSKEVTELLEQQRKTIDIDKRQRLWYRIQELAASDLPMIPYMHFKDIWAYNKEKFKGYQFMVGAGPHNVFSLTSIEPTTGEKTLVGAYKEAITHLNPMNLKSYSDFAYVWWLIYDPLMQVGLDAKPVNWLASDVKVVDDRTTIVSIRKNQKFHDGKPLTAADVKFTYDYHLKWKVPLLYPFVEPIASVETLDDFRVKFTFKTPYAPQMMATFTLIGILPKHDWENALEREGVKNPAERKNIPPIGSGPFQFVHLEPRQQLVLKRNPNHWAAPKVEQYVEVFYGTQDAVTLALASGEAHFHWGWGLPPADVPKIKEHNDLAMSILPSPRLALAAANLRRLPCSDLAFRRALSHLFNHEHNVKDVYGGYGEPQASLVPPALAFWTDPKKPFYQEFSLDKAREILRAAGYEWDGKGQLLYPKNISDKTKLATTPLT